MHIFNLSTLFLAPLVSGLAIALICVFAVVGLVVGGLLGWLIYKKTTDKKLGTVEERTKKMVDDAAVECKALKKEAILEAKEQELKLRNEFERESNEKKKELNKLEQRLQSKEDNLDKREDSLMKKNDELEKQKRDLQNKEQEIKRTQEKINHQHDLMIEELEKVAQLSREDAKAQLIDAIEEEAKRDAVKQVREIETKAKEDGEKRAREIVALAIQRCAVDQSNEITVSTVMLPSDEMKGRIIGREGRNIKALEQATGVDFIIDDTPDTVVLSAFDPVRREIARVTLEKLISDGRIHPGRIEDVVAKATKEIDTQIKDAGENAMFETGVLNLNSELIKLLGRLKFRTSYGQNVLNHSLEVAYLSGLMASELGLDPTLARRAGLLHDIGKALDHEIEGSHVDIGVEAARKYKESEAVIHAIHAHHGDVEAKTVIACIVQAADAISAARPGARRENLENYIKRLEKLEEVASSFEGVDRCYAIQAGREVRVIVKPEVIGDDRMVLLARDICKKIESDLEYPGQIKVNLIRESRAIEYAK